MTNSQLATLKSSIAADPVLAAKPSTADGAFEIAQAYNLPDVTNADAWRTSMSLDEVLAAVVWTEFIGRSQGERDAFRTLVSSGFINPGRANVRQAFLDIFSGPSGTATRAALSAAAKRKMTRGERLFATGPTGGAFDLTFEGGVSYFDVLDARALP